MSSPSRAGLPKGLKYGLLMFMEKDNLVHDFNGQDTSKVSSADAKMNSSHKLPIILFLILAVLGVGTGFLLSQAQGFSVVPSSPLSKIGTGVDKGKTYGGDDVKDTDDAEGTLREGGIEGEGSFHLERPGGVSQNVYLSSSVLDLSQFIGKKVKVWGLTHDAEKAGWLMDVVRLQVL